MANYNATIGFRAVPNADGQVINTRTIAISSSNTVPLAVGSLYYVASGQALGVPASAGNTQDVAGSILRVYTDAGCTVQNCPAATDGYMAEVAFEEGQEYVTTVDDDAFANDGTDNGKMYNVTDETLTANANGLDGSPYSKRQLDGSSENVDTRMFIASRKTGTPGNTGGVAGTEVYCKINPANWQSW